jgi:undecaprenyl-diphosphatase
MVRSPRGVPRFLVWLGGHELAVLLSFVGIASSIWLFGAIAGEVLEGNTQAFDRKILLAMRRPADRSPIGPRALQETARDITALGGVTVLGLLTLVTGGFLLLDGKRHLAVFVYGSVASGFLVSAVLKSLFQRPRPDIVPYAANFSTTSFPSGHSMLSAVTYLTLGALLARAQERKRLKAYSLLVAATLTFLVGLSRVYLGVHWPSDVLAGWTAGASWASLCWLATRWLQRRRAIEADNEHSAPEELGSAGSGNPDLR